MVSKAEFLWAIFVPFLLSYGASYESANDDDYCRKDVCPEGRPNVGCGCGSTYGPGCSGRNPRNANMDERMKALILDEHNKRRSWLACGSIEGHAPAAEMSEVIWDDELAHLAWCNAKNCVYGHDQCRSTREFYYAGQNIAQKMVCGKTMPPSAEQVTVSSIDVWFQEHQNTSAAMTDSFPQKTAGNNGPIGHFTLMCNDRVRRIGCTLVIYEEQRKRAKKPCQKHYLVCNYSYGNFVGEPTYTKSRKRPAELCSEWSGQYSCLCGTKQPYKPE